MADRKLKSRLAVWHLVLELIGKPGRLRLTILLGLTLLNSMAEMVSVGMIVPFLTVAGLPLEQQAGMARLMQFKQMIGIDNHQTLVLALGLALMCVFVIRSLFLAFVQFYQYHFIWQSRADTAVTFYRGYLEMPITFHAMRSGSDVIRNLVQAVQDLYVGTVMPTVVMISEVMVVSALIVLLVVIDPWTTLVAGGSMATVVVGMHKLVGARLLRWGEISNRSTQQMMKHVSQSLHGIKEVKIFQREEWFIQEFGQMVANNSAARKFSNSVSQYPRLALETLVVIGVVGAVMAFSNDGSLLERLPTLGLFGMAALRLMPSFNRINVQLGSMRFNENAVHQLRKDWDEISRHRAERPPATAAALTFADTIEFRDVSLRYPNATADTLDRISFRIAKGASVGFVGPSGSGKSSIINLLTGLIAPSGGDILVDGQTIAGHEGLWQSQIGLIPQDVFVLDESLAVNVAFGPVAPDSARLRDAVGLAQLDKVIAHLPHGMDTVVGERGGRLSGGERQRIGIARALYNQADVLVFDEATSALDAETEAAISDEITKLRGRKTIIVIAHRLSTVRNCDLIHYIDNGRIVASGTFDELVVKEKNFAEMVRLMSMSSQKTNGDDC